MDRLSQLYQRVDREEYMGERQLELPPDELTLHLIATGVLSLAKTLNTGEPLTLPYPPTLQRGLNRLAVACLRRSLAPPQGVPDLLTWCRKPLRDWPLVLPDEVMGDDQLLDGQLSTSVCESWACAHPDVEAELSEQRLLNGVFDTCRAANAPEAYVAFRQLLIREPVLTALEFQLHCTEPPLDLLVEHLRVAYETAPAACIFQGQFHCCGICGNLLFRLRDGTLICEDERCRSHRNLPPQRSISMRDEPVWLRRGLRRFIAAPGRTELRLADRLATIGVQVELWPAFDRYDLRLVFPAGDIWAVDVKDWSNPFLLGRSVRPIPSEPPWNQAYFVFPDERRAQRSDYLRAFTHHCRVLSDRTGALFESDLLDLARRKLQEVR